MDTALVVMDDLAGMGTNPIGGLLVVGMGLTNDGGFRRSVTTTDDSCE